MKKNQIEIGKTYVAKVSNELSPVLILIESPYGGWEGRNTRTGREVRIKSAQRLRYLYVEGKIIHYANAGE